MPVYIAFLYTPSRVRSTGALPPFRFAPQRSHRERRSNSRVPFLHLSKSLGNDPLPFSLKGLLWIEIPASRAFSSYLPGSQVKDSRLQVPLTELPQRETLHFQSPFIHLSKSMVKEPSSIFPSGSPMVRDARLHCPLLGACRSQWILILDE